MKNLFTKVALLAFSFFVVTASVVQAQDQKNEKRLMKVKIFETVNGVQTMRDTVMEVRGAINIPDLKELSRFKVNIQTQDSLLKRFEIFGNTSRPTLSDSVLTREFFQKIKDNKANMIILDHAKIGSLRDSLKGMEFFERFNANEQPAFRKLKIDEIEDLKLNHQLRIINTKSDSLIIIKKLVLEVRDISAEDKKLLDQMAKKEIPSGKVKELDLEEVKMYPNPSGGQFNLSFETPNRGDILIRILDAIGREVYREEIEKFDGRFDKEMNLTDQPKGLYYLQVIQGKKVYNKRMVLQ